LREGSYIEDSERHVTEGYRYEAILLIEAPLRATYKHMAKDGSANMLMWLEPAFDKLSCYL
jgi:hypothetical protein